MGACSDKTARHRSTNIHKGPIWDSENDVFYDKKARTATGNLYDLPLSKLKRCTKPSSKPPHNVAKHGQPPTPQSGSSTEINNFSYTRKLEQGVEFTDQNSLSDVRFLLLDLEKQMNRTSAAMLHILKTTMASYLIQVETFQLFENVRSNKKLRIFLYTTAKYVNSQEETLNEFEKIYVLGTCEKPVSKSFENIHDLIFQVAEEFGQWLERQVWEHEKLGESSLAEQKREIINKMYSQLMNISTGNKRPNL